MTIINQYLELQLHKCLSGGICSYLQSLYTENNIFKTYFFDDFYHCICTEAPWLINIRPTENIRIIQNFFTCK